MDVSDAFGDDLEDVFDVVRRPEIVSDQGRSTVPAPTRFRNVSGVLCAASGNQLDRLPDSDRMGRNLSVVTQFLLRGPSKEGAQVFKPDQIVWRGNTYVVKYVDPYPQFGPGFVQAVCGSLDVVDAVPA